MYAKVDLFNLALGALLSTKKIINTDDDTSRENTILNVHWTAAWNASLSDMDLNRTSRQKTLELLVKNPNNLWQFAYKYPADCAFLRRLQSGVVKDDPESHIPKITIDHSGTLAIYTNQVDAIVEYISNEVNPKLLSAHAGLAVGYQLAMLSAPLISGKGATAIRKQVVDMYRIAVASAKEHDLLENHIFETDQEKSELVKERLS